MTGLSILLLLTCGVVLSQGIPYSSGNSNVNSNVNSFRRNYNGNSNSNTVYPRYPRYMYKDEDEGDQGGDKIHDDVYGEISTNDVDLAVAAADATLAITKSLADDMSQTASVAVGDAVGRIVTDRRRRRSSRRSYNSRRNINSNSNTNIVGQPHPEIRDPGFYQNEDESYPSSGEFSDTREMDYDNEGDEASNLWAAVPRIGAGAAAIAFGPSGRAGSRAHMFNDNEDEEDEEEEVDEGDEKNKDEQSPGYVNHMPTGSRAWHRQNRRNYNANSNSNRIGGYRRNFNSNANSNVFRRNMNSNSNTNSFRRSNLNNNSNDNRIGRLRFYPRK